MIGGLIRHICLCGRRRSDFAILQALGADVLSEIMGCYCSERTIRLINAECDVAQVNNPVELAMRTTVCGYFLRIVISLFFTFAIVSPGAAQSDENSVEIIDVPVEVC